MTYFPKRLRNGLGAVEAVGVMSSESYARGTDGARFIGELPPISNRDFWERDRTWLDDARWIDARLVLEGDTAVPYDYGRHGARASTLCNWGFYQVNQQCSPVSFAHVMFQMDRYVEAQRRLTQLLGAYHPDRRWASRGGATPEQWADWCIGVMRVVSVARWSTNITSRYHSEGLAFKTALTEIMNAGPGEKAFVAPFDSPEAVADAGVASLWLPRDLNAVRSPINIPRRNTQFDPVPNFHRVADGPTRAGGELGRIHGGAMWPATRRLRRYPGRSDTWARVGDAPIAVREQMIEWFRKTLPVTEHGGLWVREEEHLIRYAQRGGCDAFDPAPACIRETRQPFWYGTARSTIRLCEAWAQDVVSVSFGDVLARGTQRWLDAQETLPASMRILDPADTSALRQAITASNTNDALTAIGAVAAVGQLVNVIPVVGQIVAAIIIVVAALAAGLIQLLQELGGLAIGGGAIESACLPGPFVRTIPSAEPCTFDVRPGRDLNAALVRTMAVRDGAIMNLPPELLYEASKTASQDPLDNLFGQDTPDNETGSVLPYVAGAAGVAGLGLLLWKLKGR